MAATVAAVGAQRDGRAPGGEVGIVRGGVAGLAIADGEAGFHGVGL